MNSIEMKDTYIVIQKSFIKKIFKSVILAVLGITSVIFAMDFLYCISYDVNYVGIVHNVMLVISCSIIVLCTGQIVQYFTELKKNKRNLLYLTLCILVGIHFFRVAYTSMTGICWVETFGYTENMILLCTVNTILSILVFIITLFFNTICGKVRRKLQNKSLLTE